MIAGHTMLPVGAILPYAAPVNATDGSPQQGYPDAASRAYDLHLSRQGWLVCDGRALAVARYPELFRVIGHIYGQAGAGFFLLPDYRGRGLRGVNYGAEGPDQRLRDPDATQRLPSGDGGWQGNQVGTVQDDALQAHEHLYKMAIPGGLAAEGSPVFGRYQTPDPQTNGLEAPTSGFTPPISARQAAETRVKNVYVNFIIKYTKNDIIAKCWPLPLWPE
ncbi:MAG: tail fiber protein [Paludibacterium sp.]|uniref:phage tail protein n=1 Tax=Paludibacterium sp. TaxID=1917523 RepID=UPI0025E05F85|nr:phage tail protein [Paludibacterium sp.]MBV8046455.1 tail fiber protein [Paludibacterium sp.]